MLELRKEIVLFLKHRYGISYDAEDEILITVGVSEGVDLAMRSILNPGDKVVIPEPSYVSYGPTVYLAGGKPLFIRTHPEDEFKITAKEINQVCSKTKVKALILNYLLLRYNKPIFIRLCGELLTRTTESMLALIMIIYVNKMLNGNVIITMLIFGLQPLFN